jgi:hypothetical protein
LAILDLDLHGSSQLFSRGLSKDQSPVPRRTRGGTCDYRALLIPRVDSSNAPEKSRALGLQYIAIAKAPCQALTALEGNIFFEGKTRASFFNRRALFQGKVADATPRAAATLVSHHR